MKKVAMKTSGKRKPSSSAESSSSSVILERKPGTQIKRRKQYRRTGSVTIVEKDASMQASSASGGARPSSVDTTGYECTICLESNPRMEMKSLPCAHTFHQACIDKWLTEGSRRCPMCRQKTHTHSVPSQNSRPSSRNQRQMNFGQLQVLPVMRIASFRGGFNATLNNSIIDMRLNSSGFNANLNNARLYNGRFNASLNNDGFNARLNNGGFDTRLNNGDSNAGLNSDGFNARLINSGSDARLNNGGYNARLNNDGIDIRCINGGINMSVNNVSVMKITNHGVDMRINNGGSMILNRDGIEKKFNNGRFMILNNGGIKINNINI